MHHLYQTQGNYRANIQGLEENQFVIYTSNRFLNNFRDSWNYYPEKRNGPKQENILAQIFTDLEITVTPLD